VMETIGTKLNRQLDQIADSLNCTNPSETTPVLDEMSTLLESYTPITKRTGQEEEEEDTEDTKGVIFSPSQASGWANSDQEFIDQLELNMKTEIVGVPVEDHLTAIIEEKYLERKPFLVYFWTPHQMHDPRSGISLSRMQMVDWEGFCNSEPSSPACYYPADSLLSFYSVSVQIEAPLVFEFLKNFRYSSNAGFFSFLFFSFFFLLSSFFFLLSFSLY